MKEKKRHKGTQSDLESQHNEQIMREIQIELRVQPETETGQEVAEQRQ